MDRVRQPAGWRGECYKHGFAALWQGGGGWAGLALIYFIAPRARKFAQFTIPDLLEARYNQAARVLGVIAVLFTYTAITSYQFIGGGDILHLIFPQVSAYWGQWILAGFVIVFTAIAGMGSVAYMDVVIGLLATFTMIAALPVLVHLAGGWGGVHAVLPATHFQWFGDLSKIQALELFLPTCLLMLGNQSMYQKFFSAKSEKDATRATVGWVIGTVILETVIVAIAVVGSALYRTGEVHDRPREILAYTAVHGFGGSRVLGVLGALLVGAILRRSSPRRTTTSSLRQRTWSTTFSCATSSPMRPTARCCWCHALWWGSWVRGRCINRWGLPACSRRASMPTPSIRRR